MSNPPHIENLLHRRPELVSLVPKINALVSELSEAYRHGGTLFVAGNGGSAADADHICGELLKGFKSRRELADAEKKSFTSLFGADGERLAGRLQQGLKAISLLSHPGFSSAFANDVDPELIYAQQLYALGGKGDIFIGISTGGNAANIKFALMAARVKGIKSFLLTGNRHGCCEKYADTVVDAPESETFLIQELHLSIYHAVCLEVERNIFGDNLHA